MLYTSSFFKIRFISMYVYVSMSVRDVCAVAEEATRGHQIPGN